MTIGIIEDDSLLNQALEIALQNAGYYTISAHTRKEAIDLFQEKVDAFLIDIGLPDGNGIELYQELQMEKRIPAILLTARDEEKEMLLAFDAGAQDYVVKPFSIRFYFPAQPIDGDTDCIVHYKLSVHTPDCLQNIFFCQHLPLIPHEIFQKLILFCCQREFCFPHKNLFSIRIQRTKDEGD